MWHRAARGTQRNLRKVRDLCPFPASKSGGSRFEGSAEDVLHRLRPSPVDVGLMLSQLP